MKKISLLSAAILLFAVVNEQAFAQAPSWLWARSAGGMGDDRGRSVCTDASGNVYVTGYFYSQSISFGSFTLNNANSTNYDLFIVKYDASGIPLWAQRAGGTSSEYAYGITTDAGGNVLLTGSFNSSSITFGSTVLTNTSANDDIFLVKYDPSGNVLWAKKAGSSSSDIAQSVASDTAGNVVITGSFNSASIVFGTDTLTNSGGRDVFVMKYDAFGNELWATSAGGTADDYGYDVSADNNGNIMVGGSFKGLSALFDTISLSNSSATTANVFVAKYNSLGSVAWAKTAAGSLNDEVYSIANDGAGNILITGYFQSNPITFGSFTVNRIGNINVFMVKYDPSGNEIWANADASPSSNYGYGITTDAGGNVYLTGSFKASVFAVGSVLLSNNTATVSDIFVIKLDASGNAIWGKSAGGNKDELSYSIAVDASGNVLTTGVFASASIPFGSNTVTNADNSGNTNDIFTAKLSGSITGLTLTQENPVMDIFPNPLSDFTTIRLETSLENATLVILNCFGQTVRIVENVKGYEVLLTRDDLPLGIYYVRLIEDQQIVTTGRMIVAGN